MKPDDVESGSPIDQASLDQGTPSSQASAAKIDQGPAQTISTLLANLGGTLRLPQLLVGVGEVPEQILQGT
jgi:hypothetical protein